MMIQNSPLLVLGLMGQKFEKLFSKNHSIGLVDLWSLIGQFIFYLLAGLDGLLNYVSLPAEMLMTRHTLIFQWVTSERFSGNMGSFA
ncbi:hypothetical protein PspS35_20105 [Pseudomonas sp. S35]|nr:hypothetical protein PspS35_20105 [Pseudomonas sp. S35]